MDSFATQAASNSETAQGLSAAQTPRKAETRMRPLSLAARVEAAPTSPRVPARVSSQPPVGPGASLPQANAVPGVFRPGTRQPLAGSASQPADGAQQRPPSGRVENSSAVASAADVRALLKHLEQELGAEQFERYFLGQTKLALRDGVLLVTVTSTYLAQLIERRFGEQLRKATGAIGVRFEVDRSVFTAQAVAGSALHSSGVQNGAQGSAPGQPTSSAGSRVRPVGRATPQPLYRHALDSFLVGHSNRLAFTAVKRLAEAPSAGAPVFVHGACGLGKTHLLQGACAAFAKLHPGSNVRYVTGEHFTNDFIHALRQNKVDQFRKTYRGREGAGVHATTGGVDLLCIDDVHFLSSKDATQQELLHTIDALALTGTRILLASDEHPREIRKLSEKLVSRFLACCVVKLETPDTALRRELVRQLAAQRSLVLDGDATEVLVQRSAKAIGSLGGFGGSVRELEGLLNQVEAVARLLPDSGPTDPSTQVIRPGLVQRALGIEEKAVLTRAAHGNAPRRPIAIQTIVEQVCKGLSVDIGEFGASGRHKRVVFARSVAAHLARQMTTQSFPEIARAMGRTNHSTVITAHKRLQRQLDADGTSLVDIELAPQHPGTSYNELLEALATQIRSASR